MGLGSRVPSAGSFRPRKGEEVENIGSQPGSRPSRRFRPRKGEEVENDGQRKFVITVYQVSVPVKGKRWKTKKRRRTVRRNGGFRPRKGEEVENLRRLWSAAYPRPPSFRPRKGEEVENCTDLKPLLALASRHPILRESTSTVNKTQPFATTKTKTRLKARQTEHFEGVDHRIGISAIPRHPQTPSRTSSKFRKRCRLSTPQPIELSRF